MPIKFFLSFLFWGWGFAVNSQSIDLLIRRGHVIDPKNNIDAVMDVAIDDGKILLVARDIPADSAIHVVDAKGLYVVPGLVDLHGHHFWGTKEDAYLSNSFSSLPPDGFTLRSGVTTVVDAGGPGWRNYSTFKKQTIDRSRTRVLSFINIIGEGMSGGPWEQNQADMDPKLTAMVAKQYSQHIVGIKLAHYSGQEWTPVDKVVQAGRQANVPVMIDFGGSEVPLGLDTLLLQKLRPGDIFTHCFGHVAGRTPIVDEAGKIRPYVWEAQKRGIIFDVGHGGGSFLFEQAVPALEQGFKPNTISTDLHTGSMNNAMKDMLNVMSKMLNLGMSLQEVIQAATWKPAQVINRLELGHLTVGAGADVAVLHLDKGDFGFTDVQGWKRKGDRKLVCELTLREGQVVWDLNGITRPEWRVEGRR